MKNSIINKQYEVIADYNMQFVLCHSTNVETPEPWVVWNVDSNGNTYCGRYFASKRRAEEKYCELCFDWFKDEDIEEDICFEDIKISDLSKLTSHTLEDIKSIITDIEKISTYVDKPAISKVHLVNI